MTALQALVKGCPQGSAAAAEVRERACSVHAFESLADAVREHPADTGVVVRTRTPIRGTIRGHTERTRQKLTVQHTAGNMFFSVRLRNNDVDARPVVDDSFHIQFTDRLRRRT